MLKVLLPAFTDVVFTGDEAANINFRKDYGGDAENNLFYLRNGGFLMILVR